MWQLLILQKFPEDLEAPNYIDPDDPEKKRLLGRTEVERRAEYFTQLEKEMAESQIAFPVQLIKGCLDNDPSARPTVEQLEGEMQFAMIQGKVKGFTECAQTFSHYTA